MKYDLIIANPPYGKIGNEITKAVIDNIDYGTFVNLLPANDYRRFHKEDALWQYVDINSMQSIRNAFKDAVVSTMMCKVNKNRAYYISESEFEIENYVDTDLKKYFYENRNRSHYAIDNAISEISIDKAKTANPDTDFLMGVRDISNSNMPFTRTGIAYVWNVKKTMDNDTLIEKYKHNLSTGARTCHITGIFFNTKKEHDNFTEFIFQYPEFADMLSKALGVEGYVKVGKVYPKVSWERKWTPQEILAEYGYTSHEIDNITERIKNYPRHNPDLKN